jgi:hypothetical protein
MAIGDGIRRNVAHISQEERYRLIYAFLAMDSVKSYPDGVTYWDKQEEIHKNAHAAGQDVHGGPAFLPWHRELCNRLEGLIREVDPALSLHYWDWNTDPRSAGGGAAALFTNDFMGSANGDAGFPLQDFESTEGAGHLKVWRNVNGGAPGALGVPNENTIVTSADASAQANQYHDFWVNDAGHPNSLENAHDNAHGYIGGSIAKQHFSFHDPFVFLLHSMVDKLWAKWQLAAGKPWRLDPAQVYGAETAAPSIVGNLEPWSGASGLRPWAPPENQQVVKSPTHPSVVAPTLYDFNANEQSNWRWCHKCQGLFFAGNPGSHCPAGGAHDATGSGNYSLVENTPDAHGQFFWRWCHKCQGLFFGGSPGSVCPAGAAHDAAGSGNYCLVQNVGGGPLQSHWRWCPKCQGLFFGPNSGSFCPAGGAHHSNGSGNYSLWNNAPGAPGQANWRWCHKCQGLYFAGNPGSHCPAGGAHDSAGGGDYRVVENIPAAPGQPNWRWCHKCQGMYFAGNPGSVCPAGASHDQAGSGNYTLLQNIPAAPDQSGWRWCRKCQGLFFGANSGNSCPAGDQHDSTGSGNYRLSQV